MPLPTTTMSTKGQVILPKAIRDSQKWKPGTKLVVEDRPEGILLRAVRENPFPATTIEEVFGSANYKGPTVTLKDMDDAITAEVKERTKRGRY